MTMVAADTHIWVRYLTRDDPDQADRAMHWLEATEEVFVPTTVLLELAWVLRAAYRLERPAIAAALGQVAGLPNVRLEAPEAIARALDDYRGGMDVADAMHAACCPAGVAMVTFDRDFAEVGRSVVRAVVLMP